MIPERYLWAAKTWGGEDVKGYLLTFRDSIDNSIEETDAVIIPVDETGTPDFDEDGYIEVNVDPASTKPVSIRPKYEHGNYYCPNCNAYFIGVTDGHVFDYDPVRKQRYKLDYPGLHGTTPFCGNCGMALDWEGLAQ